MQVTVMKELSVEKSILLFVHVCVCARACDFKFLLTFLKLLSEYQVHSLLVLMYHTQYKCLTFMKQDHCLCTNCHLETMTYLRNMYDTDLRTLLCLIHNSLWLKNRKDVVYADSCLMPIVLLLNVP